MNPALPDILISQAVALAQATPSEAGGEYLAARMRIIATLAVLAVQEAERGVAARIWENRAIAALLARVEGGEAAEPQDLSWRALDEANAGLRRRLITLHEAAETRDDRALQAEILELYRQMAEARRLVLPPG